MRVFKRFFLILAPFLVTSFAYGDTWSDLESRVVEHKLSNGMLFLILERHETPLVTCVMAVKAGSANEVTNKTGVAHLFEHLAFRGTSTIGTSDYRAEYKATVELDSVYEKLIRAKEANVDSATLQKLYDDFEAKKTKAASYIVEAEFFKIYEGNGGTGLNAGTSYDNTSFVITLPSNRFELWAAMESQRLTNPVFRQFYEEREVIMEERRERSDNSPSGLFWEECNSITYKAHPYGQPIIGHMSDIESLTREDVQKFYDTYYVPQNITVAIVGDVDAKKIIPIIDEYFSAIPRRPDPPEIITREPQQKDVRRLEMKSKNQPLMVMEFHTVPKWDADENALSMLSNVLGSGRTSRLYRSLVEERKIARYVIASQMTLRFDGTFTIYGAPMNGHTSRELETAVLEELTKFKANPVTQDELDAARARWEVNLYDRLASNRGMAYTLSVGDMYKGGWRENFRRSKAINELTPDDLMRVAEKYLNPDHRTVGLLEVEND